jgi:hypothetical protein
MPTYYVKSGAGGTADGSSWTNAFTTLAAAAAVDAAGDTIYVSQAHAESSGSLISVSLTGTLGSPVQVICANDGAEPPTAVATTATVTGTNSQIQLSGNFYYYGIVFSASDTMTLSGTLNTHTVFEQCKFRITDTGANSDTITTNVTSNTTCQTFTEWRDCSIRFGNAVQKIYHVNGVFRWHGGSIESGGAAITHLVSGNSANSNSNIEIEGVDLSQGAQAMTIFRADQTGHFVIRNCKLPASWSGTLTTGTAVVGHRSEMHNCDSGDTNYALWVQDYCGSTRHETTIKRTGGASDGTTGISWKMVSTANTDYPMHTLVSPEIVAWNDTTGSSVTATLEVVTDNVTLTDAECWIEVQYLGTSGAPVGSFATDRATLLATPANQTTSSETWTTTGLGTPVKQKLAVTFTPQEKGFVHARVHLAKASTTVYVCPKLSVA